MIVATLTKRSTRVVDAAWRDVLEFAIMTTICACFLAHYYYLIVLVIPFTALLVRYLAENRWTALLIWLFAYASVSAFIVPPGIVTRLAGIDVWAAYIKGAWFLPGELLLIALLLWEYVRLGRGGHAAIGESVRAHSV